MRNSFALNRSEPKRSEYVRRIVSNQQPHQEDPCRSLMHCCSILIRFTSIWPYAQTEFAGTGTGTLNDPFNDGGSFTTRSRADAHFYAVGYSSTASPSAPANHSH